MFRRIVALQILLFSPGFTTQRACAASESPRSVCQVLSDLQRYRGKVITISGVLRGGSRHGWYLQNGDEGKPCSVVERQGHNWPGAIAIVQYLRDSDIEGGPASFESDAAQIHGMLAEPMRTAMGRDDLMVVVTVIGELRSREVINIEQSKDGSYVGDGYAQGGQYPALLVLKTVKSVKVVSVPDGAH